MRWTFGPCSRTPGVFFLRSARDLLGCRCRFGCLGCPGSPGKPDNPCYARLPEQLCIRVGTCMIEAQVLHLAMCCCCCCLGNRVCIGICTWIGIVLFLGGRGYWCCFLACIRSSLVLYTFLPIPLMIGWNWCCIGLVPAVDWGCMGTHRACMVLALVLCWSPHLTVLFARCIGAILSHMPRGT